MGRARSRTTPCTLSPLTNTPRASLPPCNALTDAQWVLPPPQHLSRELGGDHSAAAWGSARDPALPRPWESPALAAAVLLRGRDEKKNNSWGFPSPPILALHHGPASSFMSKRQRLFHLPPGGANRSPLAAAAPVTGHSCRHQHLALHCWDQTAGNLAALQDPS